MILAPDFGFNWKKWRILDLIGVWPGFNCDFPWILDLIETKHRFVVPPLLSKCFGVFATHVVQLKMFIPYSALSPCSLGMCDIPFSPHRITNNIVAKS